MSSKIELSREKSRILPNERIGKVKGWGEMKNYLPDGISAREMKLLRGYFGGQVLVSEGKLVKARRRFGFLKKIVDYLPFENSHRELLILVDYAVKGKTRWDLD